MGGLSLRGIGSYLVLESLLEPVLIVVLGVEVMFIRVSGELMEGESGFVI